MLERDPALVLSVSATTRLPRTGEIDGRDYRFLTDDAFDALIAADGFLEWATVFGRRYGTPREPIQEARAAGRDVLLEIDVQGARTVRERDPEAVLVFLEPPSIEELHRRLLSRGTEEDNEVARRLTAAGEELASADLFDHVVVNDELARATDEVLAIIEEARARAQDDPERNPP